MGVKSSSKLKNFTFEEKKMVDETLVCLNCGRVLKFASNNRNRGYCSVRCYHLKPVKLACLERKLGTSFKQYVLEKLNMGITASHLANELGVDLSTFTRYLRLYSIEKRWVAIDGKTN
jgi:hypothetical protein